MRSLKSLVMLAVLLILCTTSVYASDLDGIGASTTEPPNLIAPAPDLQETTEVPETIAEPPESQGTEVKEEKTNDYDETAKAVSDMFNNARIKPESLEQANEILVPAARVLNKVMSIILGVAALGMMFVTVLDMLYLAIPPLRDKLDGGRTGDMQPSMRGRRMGLNMEPDMEPSRMSAEASQTGGGVSAVGRFVSDEAIAAAMSAQTGKSLLISYLSKRTIFLVMFGICVVLFSTTVFTDLGFKLGTVILKYLTKLL